MGTLSDSTSSTFTVTYYASSGSCTTGNDYNWGNTNANNCGSYYRRRILVRTPKAWSKKVHLAWADLINKKTKTGWVVEMIITGEVVITDPNIETRDLADFVPLLLWRASDEDAKKIQAFVKQHEK